jgi:hypothetical protein
MSINPTPFQGFSITVPVRSAREVQVVTALAELYLRCRAAVKSMVEREAGHA